LIVSLIVTLLNPFGLKMVQLKSQGATKAFSQNFQ